MKSHEYKVTICWTGNNGSGTSSYADYSRNHNIVVSGKPSLPASSDTIFRGDGTRHNPEDMLVASLSSCHMLWYLHLCADAGVIVTSYSDEAVGVLSLRDNEPSSFSEVLLRPNVTVKEPEMIDRAMELHAEAHAKCFIANSCNFPVRHEATCSVKQLEEAELG
ncbi:MAG: OsmC family protein [Ignavibacteriae bacterium]|nr:OsmC family protein [Ignavibacteriota bacterium]MCB9215248.1 OsmC family protein [Ignavibacteria bacterium]